MADTLYHDVIFFTNGMNLMNSYGASLDGKIIPQPSWVFTEKVKETVAMQLLEVHKEKELVKQVLSGKITFTSALQPLEERAKYLVDEFDSSGKKFRIFKKNEIFGNPSVKEAAYAFRGILDVSDGYGSWLITKQPYADRMNRILRGVSEVESNNPNKAIANRTVRTLILRNSGLVGVCNALYFSQLSIHAGYDDHPYSLAGRMALGAVTGWGAGLFGNIMLMAFTPASAQAALLHPLNQIKEKTEFLDDHFQKYYLR